MSSARTTTLVLLGALAACDSPVAPGWEPAADLSVQAARVGAVSLPFEAWAFTTLESLAPDASCGAPPRFLNIQVGEGTATHLGAFTVRFSFCVDATDILDDGRLTEGESIPYDQGVGILVAANGDELRLSIEGAVLPSQDPEFDFQFQDSFQFDGGTGRFAGASGSGITDSYVTQAPEGTTHSWSGMLTLPPGS